MVTAAVFHAPMFALNADAEKNACQPKPLAVDADGKRSHGAAGLRGPPYSHAPARARAHMCARLWRTHAFGDPILCVALHMDIAICTYCVYQYHMCVVHQ